jgi:hypothetical protein
LSEYEFSYGFTRKLCEVLFCKENRCNKRRLELEGDIFFENTTQSYEKEEMFVFSSTKRSKVPSYLKNPTFGENKPDSNKTTSQDYTVPDLQTTSSTLTQHAQILSHNWTKKSQHNLIYATNNKYLEKKRKYNHLYFNFLNKLLVVKVNEKTITTVYLFNQWERNLHKILQST